MKRIRTIQLVNRFMVLSLLAAGLSGWAGSASAALVVYEGFNYSPQADNTALNGSGGTGLSGSWSGWGTYRTRGLTFSDLSVAGGCAEVHSSGAVNALSNAWRQINVNVTGTIWGSFLFNSLSAMGVNGFVGELYVTKAAGGGDGDINLDFSVVQKTFNSTLGHVRLGGDTLPVATVNSGGTALSQSTTYLVLFKVENVIAWGGAAASQTITTWFLSAAQYDNFKSGGLTEAELNGAAQGSGSANVMQRTTRTATQKASFSVNDFLSMLAFANGGDYKYDEIRISDASLAEAAAYLSATVTYPTDSHVSTWGASMAATATVTESMAPYSVTFYTNCASGAYAQAGSPDTLSPYTVDLGMLAVGTYGIFAAVTDSSPKTANSVTNTFSINKANPVVGATGGTFTYDGSAHAGSGTATGGAGESLTPVTLSYSGTGGTTYGPTSTAPSAPGTYTVTASTVGDANNNSGSSSAAELTITFPVRIIVSANVQVGTKEPVGTVRSMTTFLPVTYAITPGFFDGDLFNIDSGSGKLSLKDNAGPVGSTNYVEVVATDSAETPNTGRILIEVTVTAEPARGSVYLIR